MPHPPVISRLVAKQANFGIPYLLAKTQTREAAAFGEAIDDGSLENESSHGAMRNRAGVEIVTDLASER